ncbi:MAG: chitobiase/beta-hexosaminidase C-terminal domain-containing protein [Silvibacterium sp.]|nr:chitobiase/beta-hexosaminidase C-terminal domain-containing protein [Silvibacterium sp.]
MRSRRYACLLWASLLLAGVPEAVGQAQNAGTNLQFVPVTPCRVVDTRNPTGPFGGPEMGGGSIREFDIPQSSCSIPSTAVAYSLNVTVVPKGSLNYLTVWPSGEPKPPVSTLNSDGRVKANAAIVPAGSNGGVSVFVTDETQVIIDIDGYFAQAGTASAMEFYPITPCRIADTRNPAGPLGGPSMSGGTSRGFPILSSDCNVPTAAQAYSLNVTAIPHKTLNYLSIWPTGEPQPNVSTLNSSTGAVTANAAIVPAGSNGDISVFVYDDADVILDIDGYFAPPGNGGLDLDTVAPCRVIDTRPAAFDAILPVNVMGSTCAPPSTAQAYVLNATVVPPGPLNYLTLWPDGENQPYVSTLNADDGSITSNMAIVPTNNGGIDAYAYNPTNLILDISSYFAPATSAPTATPVFSPPAGSYSGTQMVTISDSTNGAVIYYTTNGTTPTTSSTKYSGAITVSSSETLEAIAIAPGFSQSAVAIAAYTISSSSLQVMPASIPNAAVHFYYSVTFQATGGSGNYSWSLTSGASALQGIGIGLSTNGTLGGVPTVTGNYPFTVQVTDTTTHATKSESLTLVVNSDSAAASCAHDGSANALLNGSYAFLLMGFDPSGHPFEIIGDFTADGKGDIANGSADANSTAFTTGEQQYSFTGSYSAGDASNDNRGEMTWNNSNTSSTGLPASTTYCFAASGITSGVAQGGRMIAADGSGFIMSGIFRSQNAADFSNSAVNGPYAFGVQGYGGQTPLNREASVGLISFNGSGGITGGQFDVAQYNNSTQSPSYQSQVPITSSGSSYSLSSTGRGTMTVNFSGGSISFVIYPFGNSDRFFMLSSATSNNQLLVGQANQQTTTSYTAAGLKGTAIYRSNGTTKPTSGAALAESVEVGQVSFDGNGGVSITYDQNDGGAIALDQQGQNTYTVSSSGYLQISGGKHPPNFYLFAPGSGFGLQGDGGVHFYFATSQPVPASGYTNGFLANNSYAYGSLYPSAYSASGDYPTTEAGAVTFESGGVLQSIQDLGRAPDTYAVDSSSSGTYALDSTNGASTGRFVITNGKGIPVLAGYLIGRGGAFFIGVNPSNNPTLHQADHQ